jgi:hypothetical protein
MTDCCEPTHREMCKTCKVTPSTLSSSIHRPKALEFSGAALQFALFNARVHADLRALGLLVTSLLMRRRLNAKEKLILSDPSCDFEAVSSEGATLHTIVSRCSLEMRALLKLCFSPLKPVDVIVHANKTTVGLRCSQVTYSRTHLSYRASDIRIVALNTIWYGSINVTVKTILQSIRLSLLGKSSRR